MNKLYEKSEVGFSILWIVIYVVGTSLADGLSGAIGIEKSLTFIFHIVLSAVVLIWIKKQGFFEKYGLCKTDVKSSKFLYYIPLVIISTCNLWLGVKMNLSLPETLLYMVSMLCVGFLEEIIFRGFLFKAMAKNDIKSAIIVSSITFGIGHIINLVNGSGAELLSNLCQVVYAMAAGFLFVIIFYRGKTLLPCIITHSIVNCLSAFANEDITPTVEIIVALILTVLEVSYLLILLKTLPKENKA